MEITVLGAGAYGVALALAFYRNHNHVTIWTKLEEEKDELLTYHENKKALPNVKIPNDIVVTTDLSCIQNSHLIVIAIPISFLRSTCIELKSYVKQPMHFCIASKGIENHTNQFAHEIFQSIIPTSNFCILSGPTFAIDLAQNCPSGLNLASISEETSMIVKECLGSSTLKIIVTQDMIGTELCGSIKNVMAIIAGMLEGMQQSETTKSLFLTEAIEEVKHLIISFGGNETTAYTLAGIGDLLLTCTSTKSRNFTLGILLATQSMKEIQNYIENHTVEGYFTLLSIYQLIQEKKISSPLIELLYQILFQNHNQKELLNLLASK